MTIRGPKPQPYLLMVNLLNSSWLKDVNSSIAETFEKCLIVVVGRKPQSA